MTAPAITSKIRRLPLPNPRTQRIRCSGRRPPGPLRQQQPVPFFHGTQHGAAFVHDPLALAGANHGERSIYPPSVAAPWSSGARKFRLHQAVYGVEWFLLGGIAGGQLAQGVPDGLLFSQRRVEGLAVAFIAGKQVAALPGFGVLQVRRYRSDGGQDLVRLRHPLLAALLAFEIGIQQARKDRQTASALPNRTARRTKEESVNASIFCRSAGLGPRPSRLTPTPAAASTISVPKWCEPVRASVYRGSSTK